MLKAAKSLCIKTFIAKINSMFTYSSVTQGKGESPEEGVGVRPPFVPGLFHTEHCRTGIEGNTRTTSKETTDGPQPEIWGEST